MNVTKNVIGVDIARRDSKCTKSTRRGVRS